MSRHPFLQRKILHLTNSVTNNPSLLDIFILLSSLILKSKINFMGLRLSYAIMSCKLRLINSCKEA
jgi:hypothetical protein